MGFTQSSGTFLGGSDAISIYGPFTLSGGSFTATTGSLRVQGNFVNSGTPAPTFAANSGTLMFINGGKAITPGTADYSNVAFEGGGYDYNWISGTMNVLGDLTTANNDGRTGMDGGTINVHGNVNFSNLGYKGSTLIRIVGNTPQILSASASGSHFPSLEIASNASVVTITGQPTIHQSYTVTSGTLAASGSTIVFANDTYDLRVITPGSATYGNVNFSMANNGSNYFINGTLKVGGLLTLSHLGGNTLYGGTVEAYGDLFSDSTWDQASTILKVAGTAAQNVSASAGGYGFPNLIFNVGSVVNLGSATYFGNFVNNSTSVTIGTSLITFGYSGGTINPGGLNFYDVRMTPGSYGYYSIIGTLNVTRDFEVSAFDDRSSVSGAVNVGRNFTVNSGTGNADYSVNFTGAGSHIVTLAAGQKLPQRAVTLNGGGSVSLASDWTNNSTAWQILSGSLHLNGFALNMNSLSLSGNSVYLQDAAASAGALIVGGSTIGAGPAFGGTVAN